MTKMIKENKSKIKTAYFAAGCFWHVQEVFDGIDGVVRTVVGYMGGDEEKYPNPTYNMVCSGKTGYVESIKVEFDVRKISYEKLVEEFFKMHDPTTLNRQGPDIGTQYKSAIFFVDKNQEKVALKYIGKLQKKRDKDKKYNDQRKIVTEVVKAQTFYDAEDYHQKYYINNKSCGF